MSNTVKKEIKPIASQTAVAYANDSIKPHVLKLNEFQSKEQSLAKVISYHILELRMIAQGEKISHAQIEKTIGLQFSIKITSMANKVYSFIEDKKSHRGKVLTIGQFRDTKNDDGTVTPAELHVSTVAGQIGHDNAERGKERKKAKSCVEQALEAIGMPKESADNQLKLAAKGNDAAMSFVKSAMEKFTPITSEKGSVSETPMTAEQMLDAALNTLIDMTTQGDTQAAYEWLENAIELLGFGNDGENVTTDETPVVQAA